MEHQAATARCDKDKVLWKKGRSLGLTSSPSDTLPGLDDLAFDELCARHTRLAPVNNFNQLLG